MSSAELLGLVVTKPSSLGSQRVDRGAAQAAWGSASSASTGASTPGASSWTSGTSSSNTEAGYVTTTSTTLLAQRGRVVQELVLPDECTETTTTTHETKAWSSAATCTVDACTLSSDVVVTSPKRQNVAPHLGGDASQRSPLHTPSRPMPYVRNLSWNSTPTCTVDACTSSSDVVLTSPTRQNLAPHLGGDASQRSPVNTPSRFDASQRSVPDWYQMGGMIHASMCPPSPAYNLGGVSLTTTPMMSPQRSSIVSTCPPVASRSPQSSATPSGQILVKSCPAAAAASDAVKCWLSGVENAQALNGDALIEKLHAAAPQMYED